MYRDDPRFPFLKRDLRSYLVTELVRALHHHGLAKPGLGGEGNLLAPAQVS